LQLLWPKPFFQKKNSEETVQIIHEHCTGFLISCQQLYPLLQLHEHFDLFASSSSSSGLGFWVQDDSLSWPVVSNVT
jgi:hypothetical protein